MCGNGSKNEKRTGMTACRVPGVRLLRRERGRGGLLWRPLWCRKGIRERLISGG